MIEGLNDSASYFEGLLMDSMVEAIGTLGELGQADGSEVVGDGELKAYLGPKETHNVTTKADEVFGGILARRLNENGRMADSVSVILEQSVTPAKGDRLFWIVSDPYDGTKNRDRGELCDQAIGCAVRTDDGPIAAVAADMETAKIYYTHGGKTYVIPGQATYTDVPGKGLKRGYRTGILPAAEISVGPNEKGIENVRMSGFGQKRPQRDIMTAICQALNPAYLELRGGIPQYFRAMHYDHERESFDKLDLFIGVDGLPETVMYPLAEYAGLEVSDLDGKPIALDLSRPWMKYGMVCAAQPLHGKVIDALGPAAPAVNQMIADYNGKIERALEEKILRG